MADQEKEPINAPEAVPPAVAKPGASPLANLTMNVLFSAALSALVAFGVFEYMDTLKPPVEKPQRIVVVDTDALAREQIDALREKVVAGKIPSEKMPEMSRAFSSQLLLKLDSYAQGGAIVLRASSVIAYPAEVQNITGEIRASLQAAGYMEVRP